jgi:hypothetical protein
MGPYGRTMPVTGTALLLGGTAVPYPYVAAVGAAIIIIGLLLLRFVKPARMPRR